MKLNYGIIYKITNKINNKVYIGQTINTLKQRFKGHIYKKGCVYLHNAIVKYGVNNFSIEELEKVERKYLNEREIYWISFYKSNKKEYGYNILSGGNNGRKGLYKLTKVEIDELIKMDQQGISHTEIAQKFNINRKTVTFILKRESDYTSKYTKLKDRKDLNEIADYIINNNPTAKQVREKFRISQATLFKFTKSRNIHFKTHNERVKLNLP